jgi:hypothetical protein
MTIVWSYGGGTQSNAIAILIAQRKLPIPDRIIFADTGGEMTEVWDYMRKYVQPLMQSIGKEIEIAPHSLAKVDLYGKNGDLLIPAYTKTGKLPTYCSKEWKALVVRRYLGGFETIGKVIMWLGMSTDEVHRMKPADVKWIEHHWPLCDMPVSADYGIRMNRIECTKLIADFGWTPSPRSACVWCPMLDNPQLQRMKLYAPQDLKRANQVQQIILKNDKQGGVFLHESRNPNIEEIDFTQPNQMSFMEDCNSGYCMV